MAVEVVVTVSSVISLDTWPATVLVQQLPHSQTTPRRQATVGVLRQASHRDQKLPPVEVDGAIVQLQRQSRSLLLVDGEIQQLLQPASLQLALEGIGEVALLPMLQVTCRRLFDRTTEAVDRAENRESSNSTPLICLQDSDLILT